MRVSAQFFELDVQLCLHCTGCHKVCSVTSPKKWLSFHHKVKDSPTKNFIHEHEISILLVCRLFWAKMKKFLDIKACCMISCDMRLFLNVWQLGIWRMAERALSMSIFFHHECESLTLPWQRHLASEGQQQKPLKFWLFSIHVYLVSSAFKPLFNRKVKGGNICQHFPITHFHTPYKKESSLYQNNMKQFDHILRQTRCSRLVASETVKTPVWLTQGPV